MARVYPVFVSRMGARTSVRLGVGCTANHLPFSFRTACSWQTGLKEERVVFIRVLCGIARLQATQPRTRPAVALFIPHLFSVLWPPIPQTPAAVPIAAV